MIKIGFMGDIVPGGVLEYSGNVLSEVSAILQSFDLRVANLESAICDGTTKCHVKMSDPKLGNIIFSSEASVGLLKKLNINVVSLANNHVCDCDLPGLENTIKVLDENGIAHFGAGRNKEEAEKPAVVDVGPYKVGFLGYFPPMWEAPYTPTEQLGGLNHFYIDKVVQDVIALRKICDYVFVMPHWGKEHTRFPFPYDVDYAKRIIDAGATGVLGSHTHIVQPTLCLKNKIIAMSLGNFIFPDRWIVPPRMTYYPTEKERSQKNHPIVYGFPIVNELSYKKVDDKNREGVICSVFIDGNQLSYELNYTTLDCNHLLRLKNLPFIQKLKLFVIKSFIYANVYSFFWKICCVIKRCVRKLTRYVHFTKNNRQV